MHRDASGVGRKGIGLGTAAKLYPLLLLGLICPLVFGFNLPIVRRRYDQQELRRISALDAQLPEGTDEAAQAESARLINQAMERLILERPGQYLWGYNRYKQPRKNASFD